MPNNIFEISYTNPVKFYPDTTTPGKHFDDDWACSRILSWEKRAIYKQKWILTDVIKLQVQSSIGGAQAKVYDYQGILRKTVAFTDATPGGGLTYTNYQVSITLNDLSEGIYFIVCEAIFEAIIFRTISEPIDLRTSHPGTSVFKYKNSKNDFGIAFTTGIEFTFRCEAAVMNFEPDRERASYKDQVLNVSTLSATPARKFKLFVADAHGVPDWVIDTLNRIFCCNSVFVDNQSAGKFLQYETPDNSQWEITRVKGYPLIGSSIDLVPAKNLSSLQLTSDAVPAGGMVVSYNIETDAFGTPVNPSSTNPIQVQTVEE